MSSKDEFPAQGSSHDYVHTTSSSWEAGASDQASSWREDAKAGAEVLARVILSLLYGVLKPQQHWNESADSPSPPQTVGGIGKQRLWPFWRFWVC